MFVLIIGIVEYSNFHGNYRVKNYIYIITVIVLVIKSNQKLNKIYKNSKQQNKINSSLKFLAILVLNFTLYYCFGNL